MKSRAGAHIAIATVAAASLPAVQPAHAAPGRVEFAYSAPRVVQSGKRTSWSWTIRNRGERPADQVVLTHELTPKVKIASLGAPCVIVQGGAVRCDYRTLRPGERRTGKLTAIVPPDLHGKVQIRGYATWRPAPAPDRVRPITH